MKQLFSKLRFVFVCQRPAILFQLVDLMERLSIAMAQRRRRGPRLRQLSSHVSVQLQIEEENREKLKTVDWNENTTHTHTHTREIMKNAYLNKGRRRRQHHQRQQTIGKCLFLYNIYVYLVNQIKSY